MPYVEVPPGQIAWLLSRAGAGYRLVPRLARWRGPHRAGVVQQRLGLRYEPHRDGPRYGTDHNARRVELEVSNTDLSFDESHHHHGVSTTDMHCAMTHHHGLHKGTGHTARPAARRAGKHGLVVRHESHHHGL
jgi:hypothetical protein